MYSAAEVLDLEQLLGELLESPGPDRRLDRLLNGALSPDQARWRESAASPITPPLTGNTEVARYLVPKGWSLTITRDGEKWGAKGHAAAGRQIAVSEHATVGLAISATAVKMRLADIGEKPTQRVPRRYPLAVRRTQPLGPPLTKRSHWGWGLTARWGGRAWRMLYAGPVVFYVRWPGLDARHP